MASDDLPSYCRIDENQWKTLHPSASAFVELLDLPKVHPRCLDDFLEKFSNPLPIPDEDMHADYFYESSDGIGSRIVTILYQILPPLMAMSELWIRLFACVIAPLVATMLLSKILSNGKSKSNSKDVKNDNANARKTERRWFILIVLGMLASAVQLTDTMYVQEYGRWNGTILLAVTALLSTRLAVSQFQIYKSKTIAAVIAVLSLSGYLVSISVRSESGVYGDPALDVATIQSGLYLSNNNTFMTRVAELWPEEERTYAPYPLGASPLPTGDSRTGIPFLVNAAPQQIYHRVWAQSSVDDEAVAIDMAFPMEGHSDTKPIYFILHGLNGGSHEEYVREFVVRRVKEGSTCMVMIARGLADTPVFGFDVFHGARVTDVHDASKSIRTALGPDQILAGVGYSMGAIILSNYLARYGEDVHLDSGMAVSGGLDLREMYNSYRSQRLWQPMLAQTLLEDFVLEKFEGRFRQRLTNEQHLALMRSKSVSEVDVRGIVSYNGFRDVMHYYTEMSAIGESTAFQAGQSEKEQSSHPDHNYGRIANVSVPFCVLHALDDPLTSWRTMGHNPQKLVNTGSGHIMMLLTDAGGHVGWPLGLNPRKEGWKWMNNAVSSFTNSVHLAKLEQK
jgi:predicted alpha/beta-fold hydrolase